MKRIAVFCGSSSGKDPIYALHATQLGRTLAERNIGLVYGGALVGLMGLVADAALETGGEVTGVIPEFLGSKEIAHEGLSKLIVVGTMHERKQRMYELSDGFIALPGGFGTMDELLEMCTWSQLGLHQKPIGLLNTNGYYDHLIRLTEHMVKEGFLKDVNRKMILVSGEIKDLLERMEACVRPLPLN
jgi:uncharacterized protein (TIGR00730 family)